MNRNFRPNGQINYVNPNHPVNLNFVQGMNNPGHQMPNFQPQQQQMNQQPQQQQMNQPNYNVQQQQNQAPPPQPQQGNKRNRRTDVLDLQNNNAGRNHRNGNKRSGKEKNELSTSKKRGNTTTAERVNKSRSKRITSTNNNEQQKLKAVSDLQNNLQMLGVLQKPAVEIRSADAAIGHYEGVLDDQDEGKAFFGELGRTCPANSMIIPSNSYQLPKIAIDTTTTKIRHIFVKFSTDWFDEVQLDIYKESIKNNQQAQDEMTLMSEQDLATKVQTTVQTIDIFNKISDLTEQQITSVRQHYKPSGLIYVIVASGNMIDSIIAAHCVLKKIPIIQVNHEAQGDIMEVKDKIKRATKFASKINEVAKNYTGYVREKKSKALIPNQMFCFGNKK